MSIVKKDAGGNDILNTPIPPGLQGPKGGGKTITAIVAGNAVTGVELYTVSFSINSDPTLYTVDPKLQMNA